MNIMIYDECKIAENAFKKWVLFEQSFHSCVSLLLKAPFVLFSSNENLTNTKKLHS